MNKRNKIVRTADKYRCDVENEYQDGSITDNAEDYLVQARYIQAKKKNKQQDTLLAHKPIYSEQDLRGLSGYQNECAVITIKSFL